MKSIICNLSGTSFTRSSYMYWHLRSAHKCSNRDAYKIVGPDDSLKEDHVTYRGDNDTYVCKNWVQIVFATIAMLREGSKVPHILLGTLIWNNWNVYLYYFTTWEGCDSCIIMQAIGKMKNKKLNCISQNHEKHISFFYGKTGFHWLLSISVNISREICAKPFKGRRREV